MRDRFQLFVGWSPGYGLWQFESEGKNIPNVKLVKCITEFKKTVKELNKKCQKLAD